MKKLSIIITAMIICFSLAACSGTVELDFDHKKPWRIFEADSSHCAETLTYKIERYSGDVSQNKLLTADTSSYTVTLSESTIDVGDEKINTATINSVMRVVYRNDIDTADRGLTDVITSSVTFRLTDFSTLYSSKRADIAQREGEEDLSYDLVTDYVNRISTITYGDGSTKTMKTKSSSVIYDNETLYYLIRSLSTIESKGSASFSVVNMYENFLNGKYKSYSLNQTTSKTIDVEVDKNIYDLVKNDEDRYMKENDDGTSSYYLTCYDTQISLNKTNRGPSFHSYMARGAFSYRNGTTYKVPVALVNYTYNIRGNVTSTQVCTLVDYSASGSY